MVASCSENLLATKYHFNRGDERKAKSWILEPFWIQGGSQNGPLERHFRPKRLQRWSTPNGWEHPGADLSATCVPKSSKDTTS